MHSLANAIIVLWGWRRLAVAVLAGALSALALPPFNAFPVLWLTLPVFVWLIDGATGRPDAGPLRRLVPAFVAGWAFGLGYFLAGLWWIGAAFLVDAGRFAWLMPLAVLVLPAGLALFWGIGAALARAFWSDGWPRILVFAVAMTLAEWLRGHVLTGFPWNAVGYALAPVPVMMQSASLVGLWGLTLAAFFVFAAPAVLADERRMRRGGLAVLLAAFVLLAVHLGFGVIRLATASDATIPDMRLRIIQPSIAQDEKWQIDNADAIFRKYLELSDSLAGDGRGVEGVTHLIWPESAFPFLLTERPDALAAIGALLPDGATLLTGAARVENGSGDDVTQRVFNSVYVIGDDGTILSAYDKVDLVPFGEFLPFQRVLEGLGLRQLTELPGGFSAGLRRRTLLVPGAPPVGPLICYEAIFPGAATEPGNRPGWLLNLTNDAWFGNTPGPRQHFQEARLRAVEEGLALVRGANSGISAIVDPYGRVVASLPVDAVGVVDGSLPAPLPATLYARFGDAILLPGLAIMAIIGLIGRFRTSPRRN